MAEAGEQDGPWVERAAQGDPEAFSWLVQRYQRLVAGIAWRCGVPQSEIEDVVSEIFFKAYRNLDRYRHDHAFSTWLYRLATNHVIDHGRRTRRRGIGVELTEDRLQATSATDAPLFDRERHRLVRAALDELAPRYRDVMLLVYVEGLRVDETAEALRLPEGTVKSRLLRGRQAMRRSLERRHPEHFGAPS
jgi:RNA polymerase sigma-70 factor (ECF subfamily)